MTWPNIGSRASSVFVACKWGPVDSPNTIKRSIGPNVIVAQYWVKLLRKDLSRVPLQISLNADSMVLIREMAINNKATMLVAPNAPLRTFPIAWLILETTS